MRSLAHVMSVYTGSDAFATKALYARLEQCGPAGLIAMNLMRAQKNSARAKVYRGGGYRGLAYERKQWAMNNLTAILAEHAAACGLSWGWGVDGKQEYHNQVLYVDLPSGQVSFHTEKRGTGPDYPREWDGVVNASPQRVCSYAAQVLDSAAVTA